MYTSMTALCCLNIADVTKAGKEAVNAAKFCAHIEHKMHSSKPGILCVHLSAYVFTASSRRCPSFEQMPRSLHLYAFVMT